MIILCINRADMSEEEYNETKEETLDQLKELNESLTKMKEGNLSLIDEVNRLFLIFLLIQSLS